MDVLGKRGVVEAGSWESGAEAALHDPLLDKLVEGVEIWGHPALGVTFCVHRVVLEGGDLSLELLVE